MNWWNPFDWGEMMVEGAKNKVAQIIKEIAEDFIMSSYWICLIAGLIGIILFLFGYKKGKNIAMIMPGVYLIIKILGSVILGV